MRLQDITYAKEMFLKYDGSFFQMERDGLYTQYQNYMIPKIMEMQWMKEKKDELLKILLNCKNNKETAEAFATYGHYIVQMKEEKAVDFMLEYILEHKKNWDTNTTIRNINVIFSSICIIKSKQKIKNVVDECVKWLEDIVIKDIEISDDYREDGAIPDYLSKEKVVKNIQQTIEYWQHKLTEI